MKIDPIIAVTNVIETSNWYQQIFNCKSIHGGDTFDVLTTNEGEIFICLHKWDKHEHSTMKKPTIPPGNGLIFYIRTINIEEIYRKLIDTHYPIEEKFKLNTNSNKKEFSIIDPNGYFITVSEYHEFKG